MIKIPRNKYLKECKNMIKYIYFLPADYDICPKILYIKVSDKMAYANSADLDQTAPKGAF